MQAVRLLQREERLGGVALLPVAKGGVLAADGYRLHSRRPELEVQAVPLLVNDRGKVRGLAEVLDVLM